MAEKTAQAAGKPAATTFSGASGGMGSCPGPAMPLHGPESGLREHRARAPRKPRKLAAAGGLPPEDLQRVIAGILAAGRAPRSLIERIVAGGTTAAFWIYDAAGDDGEHVYLALQARKDGPPPSKAPGV